MKTLAILIAALAIYAAVLATAADSLRVGAVRAFQIHLEKIP